MRFKRKVEEDFSLAMAPLIDVVFLLLIFFMVSTAFVDFTRRMDIELPEAKAGAGAEREKVYQIEISKDKEIYLLGEKIALEELLPMLTDDIHHVARRSAVVSADRRVEYGFVVQVMGQVKEAGVSDISVAVR
ncbi:MAG: biopolymer transporter ExbD [Nitrospinota bacterium]|nr:biopolymer transporter ExbD [Nitrospinota bacterium]